MRQRSPTRRPGEPFQSPRTEAASSRRAEIGAPPQAPSPSAEIGKLFCDLRRCLRLSIPDLARRLETRVETIEALESGKLHRLPPWPETVRIVTAFTLLAKIDPRPVLGVIAEQVRAQSNSRSMTPETPGKTPAEERRAGFWDRVRGHCQTAVVALSAPLARLGASRSESAAQRGLAKGLEMRRPSLRLVLALAAVTALLIGATQTTMLQASAAAMPGPISRVLGGIHAYVFGETTRQKDGLTWIEVSDPRSRRGDKLRSPAE